MSEEADALYRLVEAGIEECKNYFRDRCSTLRKQHGKMKHPHKSEASMTKREITDAEMKKMIQAGLDAVDLIEVGKNDVITYRNLSLFLRAAVAARQS